MKSIISTPPRCCRPHGPRRLIPDDVVGPIGPVPLVVTVNPPAEKQNVDHPPYNRNDAPKYDMLIRPNAPICR